MMVILFFNHVHDATVTIFNNQLVNVCNETKPHEALSHELVVTQLYILDSYLQ